MYLGISVRYAAGWIVVHTGCPHLMAGPHRVFQEVVCPLFQLYLHSAKS